MDAQTQQSPETFRLEACRCACRSWFCDRCSVRMGLCVRTALELFMRTTGWIPFMVTLTCNPAWFQSPADAYFFCRRFTGKFVEELRRRNGRGVCRVGGGGVRLRTGHYFVGFELHESGWPHWHVVLDGTFCDIEVLREVWNLFGRRCGKEGIGHVFFTEKRTEWTIEMAIAYVTKYLTDRPENGWPDWILRSVERIRRFSSSQGMNLLAGIVKRPPRKVDRDEAHDETCFCNTCRGGEKLRCRESTTTCHAERIGRCGATTLVFVVGEREKADGEVVERRRYVATIADSVENTAAMFGVFAPNSAVVDLGNIGLETVRRLCDRQRLKEHQARSRLDNKLRIHRPKRQQELLDVGPDLAMKAIAL